MGNLQVSLLALGLAPLWHSYKHTTVESAVLLVLKTTVQGLFSLRIPLSALINPDGNDTHTERSTDSFFSQVKEFHSVGPCLKIEEVLQACEFQT